jgi:hypothetical protein
MALFSHSLALALDCLSIGGVLLVFEFVSGDCTNVND